MPVSPVTTTTFALPEHLAAKAEPALIGADEEHFAAVSAALEHQIDDLTTRLAAARLAPGGKGRRASDRDMEIHRLSARLRLLRRFGLDVCLGRMVADRSGRPEARTTYVGRLGLLDSAGHPLLIDWRTPAAEPFFAATSAHPMGLASRRRYRWSQGRITDYWDEVFTADPMAGPAALDEDSTFIASLGASRSPQMRDVLATIQADQDAAIRAGSRGALVVDGGPGTGKTVVALHRAAYLLYADPRVSDRRGGVLFVGPHRPYLAYVADVLPGLGEEGVQICTLRDLVAEGASARAETDPEVARLKSSAEMVRAIEPAVGLYEEPPTAGLRVETPWVDVWLAPEDWAEAFDVPDPGTAHNEARDQVWEALVAILLDKIAAAEEQVPDADLDDEDADDDWDDEARSARGPSPEQLRRAFAQNERLANAFGRAWTLIEAADLVGDLWSVPAYLRRCAPWLPIEDVRRLQRDEPQAWTVADLPLLDAARQRLGDPEASLRRRRREAAVAAERAVRARVTKNILDAVDDLDDDLIMLHGQDLQDALIDRAGIDTDSLSEDRLGGDPDRLAGPFAHVVVDEAQELTDAEWQMLLRRCPSRSFTVVGDRAQARHGFAETWHERLARVGFERIEVASLTVNYRTPTEVMAAAEPVIRAVLPETTVPRSIRSSGLPVLHGSRADLTAILDDWLATHAEGLACVIGDPTFAGSPRIRSLTPETAKGLEFDLVVLVDPDSFGTGIEGAVDRYVAMTRATQRLAVLTSPSPDPGESGS